MMYSTKPHSRRATITLWEQIQHIRADKLTSMNEIIWFTLRHFFPAVLCLLAALMVPSAAHAAEDDPLCFDVKDIGAPDEQTTLIHPWKVVSLDPVYGGHWVVAGDIDGDGEVEIVSTENFSEKDVHYTSAVAAQKLDGTVLWQWGDPAIGRKVWHHDVACQIHDWDGDGTNEVVLCTKGYLVELDGASGRERRRFPIPDEATDCLAFCNLSGNDRPTDVLVKNRYRQIWAYSREGDLLWTVKDPGGYRTAHQPRPMDIDGDGRDEVMASYAMLNHDGSVRWVFESEKVKQSRGHLDCARIVRRGKTPEEWRIALTCCGANNVALVDGNGRVLWEVTGHHFESIDVGRVLPDHPGPHMIVDIDHQPYGNSPIWVLDKQGNLLGRIVTDYSRHHALLDWTGEGVDEILVAHNRAIYNHHGERIATFAEPKPGKTARNVEQSILTGDMTGDGVPDVILATPNAVYIYRNENGLKSDSPQHLGTELNFTLY